MNLLITVIAGNIKDIFSCTLGIALLLFLALEDYSLSDIIFNNNRATFLLFALSLLAFIFFVSFFWPYLRVFIGRLAKDWSWPMTKLQLLVTTCYESRH